MDGRIWGVLYAVAIIAALAAAWLASTVIVCLVMYALVKSKSPLVARPSEWACMGYSIAWGCLITFWFVVASLIVDTILVSGPSLVLLSDDFRTGLVVDAVNFASEMSLAIYATSLFLRRNATSLALAILHPATLVAIFTGVTFLFDLYREGVSSLSDLNIALMMQWFWGDYIFYVIDIGTAILRDPESAGRIVVAFLRSFFAEAGGNMFRLTPIVSFILVFLSVVRLVEGLFGKAPKTKLKLISDYDFESNRGFFQVGVKRGVQLIAASFLVPIGTLISQNVYDGPLVLVSGIMFYVGWGAIIWLAFHALFFTWIFFEYTSHYSESAWDRAKKPLDV
jgi:hypothetical protein